MNAAHDYCPLCGDPVTAGDRVRRVVARAAAGRPVLTYHDVCVRGLGATWSHVVANHPRLAAAAVEIHLPWLRPSWDTAETTTGQTAQKAGI